MKTILAMSVLLFSSTLWAGLCTLHAELKPDGYRYAEIFLDQDGQRERIMYQQNSTTMREYGDAVRVLQDLKSLEVCTQIKVTGSTIHREK